MTFRSKLQKCQVCSDLYILWGGRGTEQQMFCLDCIIEGRVWTHIKDLNKERSKW